MPIDFDSINNVMLEVEEDYQTYSQVTTEVINKYTVVLDDIMKGVFNDIIDKEDPSVDTLEKYFLELSNCIYFMNEKLEKLGSLDYLSKTRYKEVYNQAYLNNQSSETMPKDKKKTVAELTALSEEEAKEEAITNDIYNRAYKVVKTKIDAAQTMISTLSKVISRRMSDAELSLNFTRPDKKVLMEYVE